jgi:hypothetical protein
MRTRLLLVACAGLAAAAVATTPVSASNDARSAAACVPKQNIEAIIDDSGSMFDNDPTALRVRAMELFIDNPANDARTLGAIEFGSDAFAVFPPATIGSSRDSMKSTLGTAILSDNGATDYNDAFSFAGAHNPNANGRIFLTDGEHTDLTPYANGHQGGPPVYVVGLGSSPNATVLQQIATDTGGIYRAAATAGELQAAVFDINAVIACLSKPVVFNDNFTKLNQTKARAVTIPRGTRSANIALSWTSEADAFTIGAIRVVRNGKTVARGAKVRKLRVTKRVGKTFVTVKVGRLVRGKLKFKLKATRVTNTFTGVNLTTQLVRSRKP